MTIANTSNPQSSELGKKSAYDPIYNPDKLFPIARKSNRSTIGIHSDTPPFFGFDTWNHYEVSWLNENGMPLVALAEIIIDCHSAFIIESKSMKLYFNSFNNSTFKDIDTVQNIIKNDLEKQLNSTVVFVKLTPLSCVHNQILSSALDGINLDTLDIECSKYNNDPTYLITEDNETEETLCSDLLKTNCLVTNQPDWCSVQIHYKGKQINHEGLLRYIISFRNDNQFTEHCIERIFTQIMQYCHPKSLTVYGRSTRRGGLDINPIRSTEKLNVSSLANNRLCRQ